MDEKEILEAAEAQKQYPITTTPSGQRTDPLHSDFLRRDRWWETNLEPKKERT